MHYYLTGGGDFEVFEKIERRLAGGLVQNDKILVLPYACDPSEFEEISERVEETFPNADIEMFGDPALLQKENFTSAAAICIEGGNTFDLVSIVRRHNLATFLKGVDSGWIYADSAGAIILGATVQTAFLGDDADDDEARLQDYRGLDLLDSWTIHAHYEPEDDDSLQDLVYTMGTPLCALPEPAAVCFDGKGGLEVLNGPVHIFNVGGKVTLSEVKTHDLGGLW
ncbi:peptidase E [Oligoflexaceae bacterium]|nr:peptidase E [Oligoflexaceae bacterium]